MAPYLLEEISRGIYKFRVPILIALVIVIGALLFQNLTITGEVTGMITEPDVKEIFTSSFEETREGNFPKEWFWTHNSYLEDYDLEPWNFERVDISEGRLGGKALRFKDVAMDEFQDVRSSIMTGDFDAGKLFRFTIYSKTATGAVFVEMRFFDEAGEFTDIVNFFLDKDKIFDTSALVINTSVEKEGGWNKNTVIFSLSKNAKKSFTWVGVDYKIEYYGYGKQYYGGVWVDDVKLEEV